MEIFSWEEEYNLGIDVIDSQHKQIVNYINELSYSIARDASAERYNVLDQLRDYCFEHSEFEEQLMKQACYFLFEPHQNIRNRFKERADSIYDELSQVKDPMNVARR